MRASCQPGKIKLINNTKNPFCLLSRLLLKPSPSPHATKRWRPVAEITRPERLTRCYTAWRGWDPKKHLGSSKPLPFRLNSSDSRTLFPNNIILLEHTPVFSTGGACISALAHSGWYSSTENSWVQLPQTLSLYSILEKTGLWIRALNPTCGRSRCSFPSLQSSKLSFPSTALTPT